MRGCKIHIAEPDVSYTYINSVKSRRNLPINTNGDLQKTSETRVERGCRVNYLLKHHTQHSILIQHGTFAQPHLPTPTPQLINLVTATDWSWVHYYSLPSSYSSSRWVDSGINWLERGSIRYGWLQQNRNESKERIRDKTIYYAAEAFNYINHYHTIWAPCAANEQPKMSNKYPIQVSVRLRRGRRSWRRRIVGYAQSVSQFFWKNSEYKAHVNKWMK